MDDDKTVDEDVDQKDDDAGTDDDDLIVDPFGKTDSDGLTDDEDDDDEKKDDDDGGDDDDDGDDDGVDEKEEIDFKAELDKVRNELGALKEPVKKDDEKKVYTKAELRSFSRLVEQKYADREITHAEYVGYKEQIEDYNEERIRDELTKANARQNSRQRAEENVTNWAQQNAPDLLDKRTKSSRDAIAFAKQHLGAELKDGEWTVPEDVGRILFSLASGAQDQEKKAEAKGREKALKEKAVRDRDLTPGEGKPPGKSNPTRKAKDKLTSTEKEVRSRLDLTPSQMKVYKRLKGNRDAEVIQ
jgi:hypothetical protein